MIELFQGVVNPKPLGKLNTKRSIYAYRRNISSALISCKNYLYPLNCKLPVFADIVNVNQYNNDKSHFIERVGSGETLIATLTNTDTGVVTIITDSTYGTLYSVGTLKSGVWGFVLDWRLVAIGLGFGNYTFHINIDIVTARGGYNKTICYSLMQFSCKASSGTVRLITNKNGYYENGFDYRNLSIGDWIDEVRLYGKFKLDALNLTVDNYVKSPYDVEQIQSRVVDNYTLTLTNICDDLSSDIIKRDLLSNDIKIDSYRTSEVGSYIGKSVSPLDIDKPVEHEINGTWSYLINFEERTQDNIKRN